MSLMSLSTILSQPILSLSTEGMDQLQQADIDDLGNMWNVFNKCKNHLANGNRLEYMSWRLWQFQRRHVEEKKNQQQQHDNIDLEQQQQEPVPIKQYISTFLSSPIHEVAQSVQKYHASFPSSPPPPPPSITTNSSSSMTIITSTSSSLPTVHNQSQQQQQQMKWSNKLTKDHNNNNNKIEKLALSYDTQQQYDFTPSRCNGITSATQSIRMITPPLEQQKQIIQIEMEQDDDDDDYEDDDDDYFLSDDDEDDDYFYYHNKRQKNNDIDFVNDFKKTQPRPPTPRRSLLSDLIQKQCIISSNPTYCSSTKDTQDLSQRDSSDQEESSVHKKNPPQSVWLESFHGW